MSREQATKTTQLKTQASYRIKGRAIQTGGGTKSPAELFLGRNGAES